MMTALEVLVTAEEVHLTALEGMFTSHGDSCQCHNHSNRSHVRPVAVMMPVLDFMVRDVAVMLTAGVNC